jgi:LPS export ABC transporter protein LptC
LSLAGCGWWGGQPASEVSPGEQAVEGGLGLKDITLKQSDQRGQLLWQLKAKAATYGESRKQVSVNGLEGTLSQQGKPAYKVKAAQAEVRQQGEDLFLKGKVIITDLRSQGVFTAKEFEWRPQKSLLLARKDLNIKHPQVEITAKEMQASSQTNQVTAKGQVVAVSQRNRLRLLTEQLVWQPQQQQVFAGGLPGQPPTGVQMFRFGQKGDPRTDRAQGGSLQADLKTQTVTLASNAKLLLADPPLEVDSQQLVWQVKAKTLTSDRPVRVYSPSQKVTLTANQGFVNQTLQQVNMIGNVKALGQRNAAFLSTDQLTWMIPSQQIEALGRVFYQQQQPRFTVRGGRAVGLIKEQKVVVTGGDVVTEIFTKN